MREVIFDTETTGLDPATGHRIVEIGCVEVVDKLRTGKSFQRYLNPQRDVPEEATRVHGITTEFLLDKPLFAEVVEEFLEFVGSSPLVIHNAGFDMKFINAELARCGFSALPMTRAVDTVQMARRKYPGAQASLDALCKRFSIDLSGREKHGALLDAELLADVYLELCGGRQAKMELLAEVQAVASVSEAVERVIRAVREHAASAEELAAHEALLGGLKNPLWKLEPEAVPA